MSEKWKHLWDALLSQSKRINFGVLGGMTVYSIGLLSHQRSLFPFCALNTLQQLVTWRSLNFPLRYCWLQWDPSGTAGFMINFMIYSKTVNLKYFLTSCPCISVKLWPWAHINMLLSVIWNMVVLCYQVGISQIKRIELHFVLWSQNNNNECFYFCFNRIYINWRTGNPTCEHIQYSSFI